MSHTDKVIVVGLGEIGKPLYTILRQTYSCVGVDIKPVPPNGSCSVLHICYPFQVGEFVNVTAVYIAKYRPKLTIINSTVTPGTTREIQKASGAAVAYSPVRGKHTRMQQDLLHYKKFVAGCDGHSTEQAGKHFSRAGFKTASFRTPEIGELSKLLETTWLGILVGWAQDAERFAASVGASYGDLNAFIEEIDFLPSHIVPGVIGGHCVMPNIELLRRRFDSYFLDAVVDSNERKQRQELKCQEEKREGTCPELA
jgi:UDP-N-acetyl-D-mannosaminuronate dehydrogenase